MGMLPLGAALGGVLGRAFGLRAPFLVTGIALLVMALVAVPVITTRAVEVPERRVRWAEEAGGRGAGRSADRR